MGFLLTNLMILELLKVEVSVPVKSTSVESENYSKKLPSSPSLSPSPVADHVVECAVLHPPISTEAAGISVDEELEEIGIETADGSASASAESKCFKKKKLKLGILEVRS